MSNACDPELPSIPLNSPFLATVDGVRTRFVKAEHVNVGTGWLCRELDGKLSGRIYQSAEMTDVEITAPRPAHAD